MNIKHLLSLLLLFVIPFTIQAQKDATKFGSISVDDFRDNYADLDENALAVIRYDRGDVSFLYNKNRGFEIESKFHMRIHILNESELSLANINIPYYKGQSTTGDLIYKIKASSFNLENGKIVESELSKKNIHEERIDDENSEKIFSIPDVKVGSIIEYTYIRKTPMSTRNQPSNWYFQGNYPVRWSELNLDIPAYFYFQIIFGGYMPLAINQNSDINISLPGSGLKTNGTRYRFAVQNAPAFINESYITTRKDYISKLEFELSSIDFPGEEVQKFNTTWDELDETLTNYDSWGEFLNGKADFELMAAPFMKIEDEKERAEAIHKYMTSNFTWNKYIGLGTRGKLKNVIKEKIGTASTLNLISLGILRAAEIEANPVILSTRRNGKINLNFPLIDRFNYTLLAVKIGRRKIFFDVTDPLLPMGVLPNRCLVENGRELENGKGTFVTITSTGKYSELEEISISFDTENAQVNGTYKSSSRGYAGRNIRNSINKLGEDEFKTKIIEGYSDWELENIAIENLKDISNPLISTFSFKAEDGGVMDDMIYFNPIIAGRIKENPFKKEIRDYPVDFAHKTTQTVIAKIEIPEGFEVDEFPDPINVKLPDNSGSFVYSTRINENILTVVSRITLSKSVFPANEYPYLKELYDLIVEKHAEQIVFSSILE